jgi:hypothetical protein
MELEEMDSGMDDTTENENNLEILKTHSMISETSSIQNSSFDDND